MRRIFCEGGSASKLCVITAFGHNSDGCGDKECKNCVLHKTLHAVDLVLISEFMEDLHRTFSLCISTLESKGIKVIINKTTLLVSGTEGEISRSKTDPCGMCGKSNGNSIMCTTCKSWVHKCMKRKKLPVVQAPSFVCARCSHMTAGTMAKKLCDGTEMVKRLLLSG